MEGKDVMLCTHPDVAKLLKSHQNKFLEELEEVLRLAVLVKNDPLRVASLSSTGLYSCAIAAEAKTHNANPARALISRTH